MDIAALSINMSQTNLQNLVQVSLMKMTVDNSTIINDQIIESIAVDPNVGSKLDSLA